jgi:hypothetical protein
MEKIQDKINVDCEEPDCFFSKEVGKEHSHVCKFCVRNKFIKIEESQGDYKTKLQEGGY